MIEDRAPFRYRWVMRGDPGIFTGRHNFNFALFPRENPENVGIISYTGAKVRYMTGLGRWQKMSYTCHYKPDPYRDSGYVKRLEVKPR